MRTRLTVLTFAVSCAAAAIACGGSSSSSPTTPTPGGGTGAGGTCRTYPTAANVTTAGTGGSVSAMFTASFNSSTNQATITSLLPSGGVCTTTVNSYRSTADFVDEVRVIPPVTLVAGTSTTGSGLCGSGTSNVTYSYDSQRRLTQFTGPGGPTTYTAWDSSGRPTAGAYSGSSLSYAYNDAARTLTLTTISGSMTSVDTITFDANGTNIMEVVKTGSNTSTTTHTITSTDRVCK